MDRLREVLDEGKAVRDLDLDYFKLEHFQEHVHFSCIHYQRNPLVDSTLTNRSAYLLCWAPYQESGIHDHPDGGCKVKILKGALTEVCYSEEYPNGIAKAVSVGDYSYQCGTRGIHNIKNGAEQAVSLHIYSPSNYTLKFYDTSQQFKMPEAL
jgi:hypothetical protein